LNVLWLTTDYPWQGDPVGGIFHRTAARCLVQAGVGVTVVSPTPMAPWPLPRIRERWRRYAEAPRRQRDGGVEILRPRYPMIPGDPAWSRIDAVIGQVARRTLARRPEIELIHAHYPAPMGMAAWHVARATGLPYVVTLHGSDDVWLGSHRSRLAVYRRALREASRILAVSQSMADEARQVAGVDATLLPIGVDVDRFANPAMTPEAARAELGLPPDRVVVLLVATLIPAKGVRPFVDAVVDLGDPYLAVVVGEGPEHAYRASDAAARNRVDYRGAQPNEAIPLYLAAADMLVLPSETEGLPTVLVEAGAAGVPVIASAVGGIPELLGNGRGLLMSQVSTAAIAEAIATVRADPTAANARAERLRSFVDQEYDAAANARRLAAIYREVVGERTDGPR
jgi:teichuronic acid biosynthesis glycosyltransferase TuaC